MLALNEICASKLISGGDHRAGVVSTEEQKRRSWCIPCFIRAYLVSMHTASTCLRARMDIQPPVDQWSQRRHGRAD